MFDKTIGYYKSDQGLFKRIKDKFENDKYNQYNDHHPYIIDTLQETLSIIKKFIVTSGLSSVSVNDPNCAYYNIYDDTCTQCLDSYFLGTNQCEICPTSTWSQGVTCEPCDTACTICSGPSITECSRCGKNTFEIYYLSGNTCIPCSTAESGFCSDCDATHCAACQDQTTSAHCSYCEHHYYSVDQTCDHICPDTCFTCRLETRPDLSTLRCYSCIDGNYLSGSECLNCSFPCSICTSSAYCDECITGYYFDYSSESYCSKCDDNCATCISLQTYCLSCQSGFSLQANSCVISCDSNQYFDGTTAKVFFQLSELNLHRYLYQCKITYGMWNLILS